MKNEKQEMISHLEELLKWYTYEATEEEYDEEEVYFLTQLLHKLYGGKKEHFFTPKASLKRFQRRYGIRLKYTKEKEERKIVPIYKRGFVKVAIITILCFTIALSVGGNVRAVTSSGLEFFQIISKDDEGIKMIINEEVHETPEPEEASGVIQFDSKEIESQVYTSWDEVPIPHGEYLWIPGMENVTVKEISATDWSDESGQNFNVCYQVGEKELWCSIFSYPNQQCTVSERYSYSLKVIDSIEIENGPTIEIRKAEIEDMFATFLAGRSSYLFTGEFTQEEFTEIMKSVEKCSF